MTRRVLALMCLMLVLASAVAPVGMAAAGSASLVQDNETADNETTLEETTTDQQEPGSADRVRISPINFGEDWLEVTTEDSDKAYNTSGPFAVFSLSEPVDNARIAQSGAEASLIDGEQGVHVDYDSSAADSGSTYFELELFFADGSVKTVDLYATQTDVSVEAAKFSQYGDLIDDMEDDATARGFEANPDGLEEYYDWQVERVELVESFLVERAAQLFATGVMFAQNPLAWIAALLTIALIAFKREQAHGWILDRIENDAGETARKHEQLRTLYKRDKQTANEEAIAELDEINDQQAQYWKDSFDIFSVHQLAELARRGPRNLEYDETLAADGGEDITRSAIGEIDPAKIRDSWLAPAFSTNRLSGPHETLSTVRACLIRMENTYGMGHVYNGARADVEELIEELNTAERGFE